MRYRKAVFFTFIAVGSLIQAMSQDSLYAKAIDSLWFLSYDRKMVSTKREKISDGKVEYSYYKRSNSIRSIVVLNKFLTENLLFFYLIDKPVMISPSGQQPYYIMDDHLAYARRIQHTPEQIQSFITIAYNYLRHGYEKIKGKRADCR